MAEKVEDVRSVSVLGTRYHARVKGGPFQFVPGVQGHNIQQGSRSVQQVQTTTGEDVSLGSKTVEPVTLNISATEYGRRIYNMLAAAENNGDPVALRIDQFGYETYDSANESDAATSAKLSLKVDKEKRTTVGDVANLEEQIRGARVTLDGTNAEAVANVKALFYGQASEVRGSDLLFINNEYYVINSTEIDANKQMTNFYVIKLDASAVTVDVAATNAFKFRVAGYRRQFACEVESIGDETADVSGSPALAGTIIFRPKGQIGLPVVTFADLP